MRAVAAASMAVPLHPSPHSRQQMRNVALMQSTVDDGEPVYCAHGRCHDSIMFSRRRPSLCSSAVQVVGPTAYYVSVVICQRDVSLPWSAHARGRRAFLMHQAVRTSQSQDTIGKLRYASKTSPLLRPGGSGGQHSTTLRLIAMFLPAFEDNTPFAGLDRGDSATLDSFCRELLSQQSMDSDSLFRDISIPDVSRAPDGGDSQVLLHRFGARIASSAQRSPECTPSEIPRTC